MPCCGVGRNYSRISCLKKNPDLLPEEKLAFDFLQICDFGLARAEDSGLSALLTQEVVTQYYRAPEILMGCHRYSYAIDMWSVGCILSELLLRRILFQAHNVVRQLELMVELLGPPPPSLLKQCSSAIPSYILKKASRRHNASSGSLSPNRLTSNFHYCSSATKETVHLLSQLLVFDPVSLHGKVPKMKLNLRFYSFLYFKCSRVYFYPTAGVQSLLSL